MKHYIGFLKIDLDKMLYFTSDKKPTRFTHWYFGKVLGPYSSESEARNTMGVLKRGYGYRENPVRKNRKNNPGDDFHVRRFIRYMKELEKYKVGSCEYKVALARANEHMESVDKM
jgi:excinuclease UvrABC nuclease subunit